MGVAERFLSSQGELSVEFAASKSDYAERRRRVRPSRRATLFLYLILLLINVCVILACTTGGIPAGFGWFYRALLPPLEEEPAMEEGLTQYPPGENWCNGSTPPLE